MHIRKDGNSKTLLKTIEESFKKHYIYKNNKAITPPKLRKRKV